MGGKLGRRGRLCDCQLQQSQNMYATMHQLRTLLWCIWIQNCRLKKISIPRIFFTFSQSTTKPNPDFLDLGKAPTQENFCNLTAVMRRTRARQYECSIPLSSSPQSSHVDRTRPNGLEAPNSNHEPGNTVAPPGQERISKQ